MEPRLLLQAAPLPGQIWPVDQTAWRSAAGDFNGDHRLDVAIAEMPTSGANDPGTISVQLNQGNGVFGNPISTPCGSPVTFKSPELAVGDFNGDGQDDLAVQKYASNYDLHCSILLSAGDGTFLPPTDYLVTPGGGYSTLRTGDFNNDGKTDLAFNDHAYLSGSYKTFVRVLFGNGNGTFDPTPSPMYPVADGATDYLAVGDFDGDGKSDLAIHTEYPSPIVSVLWGKGDGTFEPHQEYAVDAWAGGLTAADLNGDGITDLATTHSDTGLVQIDLGNKARTFQTRLHFSTDATPAGLSTGDLNGDGNQDLMVFHAHGYDPTGHVRVYLGNGDATFQAGQAYPASDDSLAYRSGLVTDLTGDGHVDLGFIVRWMGFTFLEGVGDGTFRPASGATWGNSVQPGVVCGDFNGDGEPDLATAGTKDATHRASVLLNNGDGTFAQATNLTLSVAPGQLAAADLNGNNALDLIVGGTGSTSSISVLLGNGDGTFASAVTYTAGSGPALIATGDFNKDNHPDVAVGNTNVKTVSILLGNGDGTLGAQTPYTLSASDSLATPRSILAVDLNEDTKTDLVVGTQRGLYVLQGKGDGTFLAAAALLRASIAKEVDSIASGDLNGDGHTDLVVAERDNQSVWVLLGKGDATFPTCQRYNLATPTLTPLPYSVCLADFDGDGDLDMAILTDQGLFRILHNNGQGVFSQPTDYAAGSAPGQILAADLNADATPDVVTAGNTVPAVVARVSRSPFLSRIDSPVRSGEILQGTSAKAPYLIVSVDDQWQVLEQHQLNNEYAAETDLQVPLLTDGVPVTTRFAGSGAAHLYQMDVPAGGSLRVRLDDADGLGVNELYAQLGAPPTRSDWRLRYQGTPSASPEILIPAAAAGTWYFLAYGASVPGSGGYTITAETGKVFVADSHPDRLGNLVDSTLTVKGAGFVPGTRVGLVAGGGTVYWLDHVRIDSFTRLEATVPPGAVSPGTYAVRVALPSGESADLAGALQVLSGAAISRQGLRMQFFGPDRVGYHHTATFYLQYTNAADLPMPAPVVGVTAFQNGREAAMLTLDPTKVHEAAWSSGLIEGTDNMAAFLASGQTTGILMPGETMITPVYYSGWQMPYDLSYPPIQFFPGSVTGDSTTPIQWNDLKDVWRPSSISTEAWEPIWANFVSLAGATGGEYLDALTQNALYLARLGANASDMGTVLNGIRISVTCYATTPYRQSPSPRSRWPTEWRARNMGLLDDYQVTAHRIIVRRMA